MTDTGIEFLRLCAIGLGLDEHCFDKKFLPKPTSTIGIIHYPAYDDVPSSTLAMPEHFDGTFVALLVTFNFRGLEVLNEHNEFVEVPPRPGSLVVNIGELLSRMTNRQLRATVHRVKYTGDRYSCPYFFQPRGDSQFEFPKEDELGTITFGSFLADHLRKFPQYSELPKYPDTPMFNRLNVYPSSCIVAKLLNKFDALLMLSII